jgi:hypothetical protein
VSAQRRGSTMCESLMGLLAMVLAGAPFRMVITQRPSR